ncbi:MAG: hypothetical protein GY868_09260 [Deltaproteobacteria bacterium]|nr:hypothetical protein [Deltaproteobacteria bacterium]
MNGPAFTLVPGLQEIIDRYFCTGVMARKDMALLIPALVRHTLAHDPKTADLLKRQYGPDLQSILAQIGTAILDGSSEAQMLVELMISKTRQDT